MLLILSTLFLSSAHADLSNTLFDGCEKLTHTQWVKRYDSIEDQVIESIDKNPKFSKEASEAEFVKVVYPQELPKSFPMKGAFLSCFSFFEDYQKATKPAEIAEAQNDLDECYARAYRVDPPKVISRYMACLKKIKN